jgi:predicted PurR-regulated permease PerM
MSKENKLSNLFVCFKETTNHPFNINIINVLKQYKTNAGAAADKITDQAIGKIYEKYLSINNELSRHISTISKSKLNETILQIIISIVFIIYLVIFFYLFWT